MVYSTLLKAAAGALALTSASAFTFEVIDNTSPSAHVSDIEFTITPSGEAYPGDLVVVDGSGVVDSDVTGGSYSFEMESLGLNIFSHTGPLCGDDFFELPLGLGNATVNLLECPEKEGDRVNLGINVALIANPPTDVFCAIRAYQQGKEEMITFDLNVYK